MLEPDFKFRIQACAELIRDESTLATPLMVILIDAYGDRLFEMDSVELYIEIEEDFNARLTESGENRVQAALLAITTNMFYYDPLVTRSIAMALYEGDLGDMVNGVLEDIALPEVAWATYEIGLLRDDDEEMTPAVKQFLMELVKAEGEDLELLELEHDLPATNVVTEDMKTLLVQQLALIGVNVATISEFV